MKEFNDNILYKTHQHKIVLFFTFLRSFVLLWFPLFIISYLIFKSVLITIITIIFLTIIIFLYYYFFWVTSYLLITNRKIIIRARSWIFSRYNMSIYYENIKDIAYSKNNVLHYFLNYWTFFARSSAWAQWDFEARNIPNISKIYKIINYIYILSPNQRETLTSLDSLENRKELKKESVDDIIEKEKNALLSIKWIKEVILLNDQDKKYIFENEEDRNHWVFESIRKKIVLCFTHDSSFRNAEAPIVLKLWNKVIFPAVNFSEIKRSSVISSSPWLKIHQYLASKFQDLDEYDATVFVWFDI